MSQNQKGSKFSTKLNSKNIVGIQNFYFDIIEMFHSNSNFHLYHIFKVIVK